MHVSHYSGGPGLKVKFRCLSSFYDPNNIFLICFFQLFEKMAVIDVYAGSESLVTSSGRVTGLPTKEQLDVWILELENIESETEQFDQGDMIRLKDFAKSRWSRHPFTSD
jgi:hypothetical protein